MSDLTGALECWREANVARGKAPDAARVERVQGKLADPAAHVLVAVHDDEVCGMLLAEPGRVGDGGGPMVPGLLCHVSVMCRWSSCDRSGGGAASEPRWSWRCDSARENSDTSAFRCGRVRATNGPVLSTAGQVLRRAGNGK
ncbi:MAG TPA: hypothetical protein VG674_16095 [Amycolatopsis sp.]|nr:hypothetical protein [Amycolatopsis sp.]